MSAEDPHVGQPVLKDVRPEVVATGVVSPAPDPLTTAEAADADAGAFDAALVRVEGAIVQDTARDASANFVIRVDDGSGTLDIVLDRDIAFFFDPATLIGSTIAATGVLVPSEVNSAVWVLKPRRNEDVSF